MLFLAQPNFDTTPCISRVSVIRSTCRQHKQPNQPMFSILGFLGLSLTLGLRQSKSQNTASKLNQNTATANHGSKCRSVVMLFSVSACMNLWTSDNCCFWIKFVPRKLMPKGPPEFQDSQSTTFCFSISCVQRTSPNVPPRKTHKWTTNSCVCQLCCLPVCLQIP